jgi:hypothetical protein
MIGSRDWSLPLAVASLVCLGAMLGIGVVTGVSQETFEVVRPAAVYAAGLREHGTALRALFGIDSAFLVLYTAFFVVFGRRIATDDTRALITIASGFIFATVFFDMVEDHHILAMLNAAEAGSDPTAGQIVLQQTISQVKFNLSYVALFLYGLAVPRRTRAGLALSLLLTVGTLVQGVWLYAAPASMLPAGNLGRGLGFMIGFALAIPIIRDRARQRAD